MAGIGIVPLFGRGFKAPSPSTSVQGLQNMYYRPSTDKGAVVISSTPGLRKVMEVVAGGVSWPCRGAIAAPRGTVGYQTEMIYGAFGPYIVEISPSGGYRVLAGSLDTSEGPVYFAYSGTTLSYVDGVSCYYTTLNVTTTIQRNSAAWVPSNPTSICFYGQRFVISQGGAGKFWWSDLLSTGGSALNFATAESDTDALLGVSSGGGSLYLWGTRTVEAWVVTGAPYTFAAQSGTAIGWGCASFESVAKVGDGFVALMRNSRGDMDVRYVQGLESKSLCDADFITELNQQSGASSATGFGYFMDGSERYQLNIGGKSYLFDMPSGNWSTLTYGTQGARHRANKRAAVVQTPYVFDYENGSVYVLDREQYTDDGETIVRTLTTKHLFNDLNRITVNELLVDLEAGAGLTLGQGDNPQVWMQVSRDNGHSWGPQIFRSAGARGKYVTRVLWERLGRSRDFVFRLGSSDPWPLTINNMAIRVTP